VINPWYETLGVFDLETTGINPETSRIVSAHVGVIDASGDSVELRTWLADPGVEIPEGASAVHGITTARARAEGRPAAEVVAEIITELKLIVARGIPVTIFNAPYDLTILDREARRYGVEPLAPPMPTVDPLILDKAMDRWRKGKRTLEAAALVYGVVLDDAHNASADAVAAGRVAQAIGRRYEAELAMDAQELHRNQVAWAAEQAANFQAYMRSVKDPAFVADGSWPQR